MKIGDVDGKGRIYAEDGCAMLEEGEDILDEFNGELLSWIGVYPSGPDQFKYIEFEMHILGEFITTTRRMIFVGMPVSAKDGFYAGGGLGSTHPNYQYIKGMELRVTENDARLYFSIPIAKVKAITPEAVTPEIIAEHQGTEVAFNITKEVAARLYELFIKLEPKK